MPSAERCSPSVGLRRQLPRKRWRLLVYFTSLQISLPIEGGGFCEAKDGGVASELLLFSSTPQSIRLAAYCQLPGRGAFWCSIVSYMNTGTVFRPPHLHNLSRSPAVRRISHGGAIFHIAQAIFHCGRKPAYIVPVTTTVVTPGVTLTTPVVVSCVNVAAGTVSVVAAPVSGRVSTPAV